MPSGRPSPTRSSAPSSCRPDPGAGWACPVGLTARDRDSRRAHTRARRAGPGPAGRPVRRVPAGQRRPARRVPAGQRRPARRARKPPGPASRPVRQARKPRLAPPAVRQQPPAAVFAANQEIASATTRAAMIARIAAIASRSHPASGPACPGRRSPRMFSPPVRSLTPCAPHVQPRRCRAVTGSMPSPERRAARSSITPYRNSPYINSRCGKFPVRQVSSMPLFCLAIIFPAGILCGRA